MTPRRSSRAALVVAMAARAAVSDAQERPGDGNLPEARAAFEAGLHLLEDARYAEAAASLERSLVLRESPSVLYNLGLAWRGTGAYRRAIGAFERYLQVAGAQEPLRAVAQSILTELRDALAVVTLTVRGDAAEVLVDAQRTHAGDGTTLLPLDPGTHTLEVHRSGYQAQHSTLRLSPGARESVTLDASAEPIAARLHIDCDAPEAEIFLDGRHVGRGNLEVPVDPGAHEVEVRDRDQEPHRRALDIAPGSAPRLSFALRRPAPSVLSRWWFWAGAAVLVTGVVVGSALLLSGSGDPVPGTWGTAYGALRAP